LYLDGVNRVIRIPTRQLGSQPLLLLVKLAMVAS
jgi:hypothetical protein